MVGPHACFTGRYATDGDDDRIEAVSTLGMLPTLVQLLGHEKSAIVTPCLRTVGNIISGNDIQAQRMLDAGALPAIAPLLQHEKVNIQKEACWTLSNITGGTAAQAAVLVNFQHHGRPLIRRVCERASGGHVAVRKEALWVLANVCTGENAANIRTIVDAGALPVLRDALAMDRSMVGVGLDAILGVLTVDRIYAAELEQHHVVDVLERLIDYPDEEIYQKATRIFSEYFAAADDDDNDDDDDGGDDGELLAAFDPGAGAGVAGGEMDGFEQINQQ